MKLNLTDPFIRSFPKPEKRIELYDTSVKGLALRVAPTGRKVFVLRYRYGNDVKRYTIGQYPTVGLAKAREEARNLLFKINRGTDPLIEKKRERAVRVGLQFSELCDFFIDKHLPTLRKKTSDEYKRLIQKELKPVLGRYELRELQRAHFVNVLDTIALKRNAVRLSNHVRAVLSSLYSFGIEIGVVTVNPITTIKKKRGEVKRSRTYSIEEIKSLWSAFELQEEPVQSVFKMLMICGQRLGETRRMKWSDIKDDIWVISKDETKSKREHHLPLPPLAQSVLDKMKIYSQSDYVFESSIVAGQPIQSIQKASERIKSMTGVTDFRIHDMRRIVASQMAGLGVERTVLGKVLNHKGLSGDNEITAIYDRHEYLDEMRVALNKWSTKLLTITESVNTDAVKR